VGPGSETRCGSKTLAVLQLACSTSLNVSIKARYVYK
jgi:hypothetical protein